MPRRIEALQLALLEVVEAQALRHGLQMLQPEILSDAQIDGCRGFEGTRSGMGSQKKTRTFLGSPLISERCRFGGEQLKLILPMALKMPLMDKTPSPPVGMDEPLLTPGPK